MEVEIVEDVDFIDAQVAAVDSPRSEPIRSGWIKSVEALRRTGLGKSAFQQAVTKLTSNKYDCPLRLLRRGEARNTEYSLLAVDAIKLLNSGGDRKLREMLLNVSRSDETIGGALIVANKNNQIAQQRDLAADENFKSAKTNLSNAMANYRELGRSFGKKVVKEFEAGFAQEVDAGLKGLGVQAENVFDVED